MSSPATRILLVDDESDLRMSLRRGLEMQGYVVETGLDGLEAIAKVREWKPDLLLLDLAMPRMGGVAAIQQIRTWSSVPIIVLSVMGDESEKVRALDIGADDYLTKPFGVPELAARIRATLRRLGPSSEQRVYHLDDVDIDLGERRVTVAGEVVHLTPNEYDVLRQLILNAGRVLTHRALLQSVWGPEYTEETQYLRPIITALRKKLGRQLIQTEPAVGYRLRVTPAE